MNIYETTLQELSAFTNMPIESLKQTSYATLETMITQMQNYKLEDEKLKNKNDSNYAAMIRKFFAPFEFLKEYFEEDDIINACAMTGVTKNSLCTEINTAPGATCHATPCEYIRTCTAPVKQYDRSGNEYAERKYEKRDIYLTVNPYQGNIHGPVIKMLLLRKYPELAKYNFECYSYTYNDNYEIYPENHIYTPFKALMDRDINTIKNRNIQYCREFNHGIYTIEQLSKRFDENEEFFETIRNLKPRG